MGDIVRTMVVNEKTIIKIDEPHVKDRAMKWYGIELHEDNLERMAQLIYKIEYDKKGVKRSRQQQRKLIRANKSN